MCRPGEELELKEGVFIATMETLDVDLARISKAIVALAFRNGPIEDLHAGKACPMCHADERYSHITDAQMTGLMKSGVNQVYRLLWLMRYRPADFERQVAFGERYASGWDDPAPVT